MSVNKAALKRALYRVSGKDAAKLIQGLMSQDMRSLIDNSKYADLGLVKSQRVPIQSIKFDSMKDMTGITGNFMNPQGKVVADCSIFCVDGGEGRDFIVDCDPEGGSYVFKSLMMHKLKADAQLKPIPNLQSVQLWVPSSSLASLGSDPRAALTETYASASVPGAEFAGLDPRYWRLGVRTLVDKKAAAGLTNPEKEALFRTFRVLNGVPEGFAQRGNPFSLYGVPSKSDEEGAAGGAVSAGVGFPYHLNLDWVGGISLSKGCYLGQELTTRTFHSMSVRRRLFTLLAVPSEKAAAVRALPFEQPVALEMLKNETGDMLDLPSLMQGKPLKVTAPGVTMQAAKAALSQLTPAAGVSEEEAAKFAVPPHTSLEPLMQQLQGESKAEPLGAVVETANGACLFGLSWRRCDVKTKAEYLGIAQLLRHTKVQLEGADLPQGWELVVRPAQYVMDGMGSNPTLAGLYCGL